MPRTKYILWLIVILILSCRKDGIRSKEIAEGIDTVFFGKPLAVKIDNYQGHVMEPFLSRDGQLLFFNNLNAPSENTNLHWCKRVNDTLFSYEGEIANVNTSSLEAVPSMDKSNMFYFVHTGSYEKTFSTIYRAKYSLGRIEDPVLVADISRKTVGWVNFDVEISHDGKTLYFVDGRFNAHGGPYEANLVIAKKENGQFYRYHDSDHILQNINTRNLEYAAAITKNELEICFTRVSAPLNDTSSPKIYIATRKNTYEPFSNVQLIGNLIGFVEAPTYTPDDEAIYFHKKEDDLHRLYFVRKR